MTTTKPLTIAQKNEAVREKLRARGIHIPPKGEWRKSLGHMEHAVYFDEATRLGAEWRAEEDRRSLTESDADS